MNLARYLKHVERLVADNSPVILTGVGVAGTLATAYLTGKASLQAAEHFVVDAHERNLMDQPEANTADQVKLVWKLYLPAAGTCTLTVAAIICANRISTRRVAAMAAAYSVSEKAYSEYKDKIVEKMGVNKEQAVRDELAQEKVDANPSSNTTVVITGNGDVQCFDIPNQRYFMSNMETLRRVQNDINKSVIDFDLATLSDFYSLLDLPRTPYSEELGWSRHNGNLLEIVFSTTLSDTKIPCIAINYNYHPIRGSDLQDDPSF